MVKSLINYNGEIVISSRSLAELYCLNHKVIITKLKSHANTFDFIPHFDSDRVEYYITYGGFKYLTKCEPLFTNNIPANDFWRGYIISLFEDEFEKIRKIEERKENEVNKKLAKREIIIDDNMGIKVENTRIIVSSRDVAKQFGKRHDNVVKDIKKLLSENPDNKFNALHFQETTYKDSSNRTQQQYLMTREGFTLLVFKYTGPKYIELKQRYIEKFSKMDKELEIKNIDDNIQIPKTFSEALRLAADIQEEKEKLEKQIMMNTPKVEFADAVSTSDTDILIRELSKLLTQNGYHTGERKLYEQLRHDEYLISSGVDRNRPTQRSMNMGLFRVKEITIQQQERIPKLKFVTKVTPKGQMYFINKYCKLNSQRMLKF